MFVIPVETAYRPLAETHAVGGWGSLNKRVRQSKANDNPALEITRTVPADSKGQFLDVLS